MNQVKIIFTLFILMLSSSILADNAAIMLFASNNTNEIDVATAITRLQTQPQLALQKQITQLMQQEHIQFNSLQDLLGVYKMQVDDHITADNSAAIDITANPQFQATQALQLAHKLAERLQQESVAVFVPKAGAKRAETIVMFHSPRYSATQLIKLVQAKLPNDYSNAFSLQLRNDGKVAEVIWLGDKTLAANISKIFPNATITQLAGLPYLVYKDGQVRAL